ncbi:uncharacterized protein [Aquarana catesbeiana]
MSRWSKRRAGRTALLPLLLLALALGGAALFLASLNLLLTTTAWGQSLIQGRAHLQQVLPIQEPQAEAQIFFKNVWEKHQFLFEKLREERSRQRRSANKKNRNSRSKSPILAAHYEVKPSQGVTQMNADSDGNILYWSEVQRNSTSPLRYDERNGEFTVTHKGLYYLYCQVHFNEDRSSYIKLDLILDSNLIFRCLQEFSATVASIGDPKRKTCSVSGLVIVTPGSLLRIRTLPRAVVKVEPYLTYFGLFQVHMTQAVMFGGVPGLARGLWGGTGAWLGVLLCLMALVYQSIHLDSLQRELSLVHKSREASKLQARKYCETPLCHRKKREAPGAIKKRHDGNRSLLHLVAESVSSIDSEDRTEISWKTSLQEGRSLEVQGRSIRIKHSGIYSIYSQVFYRDVTFTMGHVVLRRSDDGSGEGEILLSCVQSMPSNDTLAYNTCYTSGIFRLHKGNSITLQIPRRNAALDIHRQATFLGFIKL